MAPVQPQAQVGFVTCSEHRNLSSDDLILAAALERRGVRVAPVVWTESSPQNIACRLLLLRSVWDYHLHPQEFLEWVTTAHARTPVVNDPEVVRWNMDKKYLRDIEAEGFCIPRTVFIERGTLVDLPGIAGHAGLDELIVKPAISASAFETHRLGAKHTRDFNGKFNALLQSRSMLVQEFVGEIETSGEWSLVFFGPEFSHAAHKLPRPGDFRVQHEFGGTYCAATPPASLLETARVIVSRFASKAMYCRVDMVMCAQGPMVMELELIDPLLHFELALVAVEKLADHIVSRHLDLSE